MVERKAKPGVATFKFTFCVYYSFNKLASVNAVDLREKLESVELEGTVLSAEQIDAFFDRKELLEIYLLDILTTPEVAKKDKE